MRRLICGLLIVLWAAPVSGQAITRLASQSVTGTMTTNGNEVVLPVPVGVGFGSIGAEARGTWTGTVEVQCAASTGGGTFVALTLAPRNSTSLVTSFTANGQWSGSIAGCQRVRATATAAMTGTVTITLVGNFTASAAAFASVSGQATCLAFGGTDKMCASATAVTSTVPVLGPDGAVGAPSYSFANNTNMGLYRAGNNNMGVAVAGTQVASWQSSGLLLDGLLFGVGTADVSLSRLAADVVAVASGDAYGLDTKAFIRTDPTIASGFGTNPAIVVANGSAAFTINVGTGGTASAGVVTMPAATTGWACQVENVTGVAANRANQRTVQTATTTTSITIQNQTISTGAALAWTASDVVRALCTGY